MWVYLWDTTIVGGWGWGGTMGSLSDYLAYLDTIWSRQNKQCAFAWSCTITMPADWIIWQWKIGVYSSSGGSTYLCLNWTQILRAYYNNCTGACCFIQTISMLPFKAGDKFEIYATCSCNKSAICYSYRC